MTFYSAITAEHIIEILQREMGGHRRNKVTQENANAILIAN
jgi:hypothetical protein